MAKQRFDFETPDCIAAMQQDGAFVERGPDYIKVYTGADIPSQPVPECVSPWQIRKAINATAGMRTQVDALLASPQTPLNVKDGWVVATEWRRDDPVLLGMAQALSLTGEQIDNLFRLAATL